MSARGDGLVDLMHAEIDGLNSADASRELKSRLARDDAARREFESLANLDAELASVEALPVPPGLRDDVMRAIGAVAVETPAPRSPTGTGRRVFGPTALRYAWALAAGVLIGAVGIQWLTGDTGAGAGPDVGEVTGTMTAPGRSATDAPLVGRSEIDTAEVRGSARVARTPDGVFLALELDALEPVTVSVGFDSRRLVVRSLEQSGEPLGTLELGDQGLAWGLRGRQAVTVALSATRGFPASVDLQVSKGDDVVHEASFVITGAR